MQGDAPSQAFSDTTKVVEIAPDEVRSIKVRFALDYWRNLRGAKRFPARAEIKPREIKGVLTNMVLIQVIDAGRDFLFRVVGDHAGRGYNVQLTNRLLSDVSREIPRAAGHWRSIFGKVVASGEASATRVSTGHDAPDANFTEAEAVFLPLGSAGHAVEHIICVVEHVLKP